VRANLDRGRGKRARRKDISELHPYVDGPGREVFYDQLVAQLLLHEWMVGGSTGREEAQPRRVDSVEALEADAKRSARLEEYNALGLLRQDHDSLPRVTRASHVHEAAAAFGRPDPHGSIAGVKLPPGLETRVIAFVVVARSWLEHDDLLQFAAVVRSSHLQRGPRNPRHAQFPDTASWNRHALVGGARLAIAEHDSLQTESFGRTGARRPKGVERPLSIVDLDLEDASAVARPQEQVEASALVRAFAAVRVDHHQRCPGSARYCSRTQFRREV
jgi:hypothetical protein